MAAQSIGSRNRENGNPGGVIQSEHLIEHALRWKAEGRIRHLGFSFHSSAKLLDRILTEHPEFEFVQIAANYVDWNSQLVQAGACYDVIRKHGKQVVIMEPVRRLHFSGLPKRRICAILLTRGLRQ